MALSLQGYGDAFLESPPPLDSVSHMRARLLEGTAYTSPGFPLRAAALKALAERQGAAVFFPLHGRLGWSCRMGGQLAAGYDISTMPPYVEFARGEATPEASNAARGLAPSGRWS